MASFRAETYAVFGLPAPAKTRELPAGKTTGWFPTCDAAIDRELETGQVLLHKPRAWAGLALSVYVARHSDFFLKRLFRGDKMTFHFGFAGAHTPYTRVPHLPRGVGVQAAGAGAGAAPVFCANTMGQHHPDTGVLFFLHRTMAKFKDVSAYLDGERGVGGTGHPHLAWTHMATQAPLASWDLIIRGELPPAFFMGGDASTQNECVLPRGADQKTRAVPAKIAALEQTCLRFLADLNALPFYPANRRCTPESAFFCSHP